MKVLIVCEKLEDRNLISVTFSEMGFSCITAENGVAAMQTYILNSDVDLIVSDLAMPVMDGCSLINEIRNSGLQVPIIILCQIEEVANAIKCFHSHANDFIIKDNFLREKLLFSVERVLSHIDVTRENTILKKQLTHREREIESIGKEFAELNEYTSDFMANLAVKNREFEEMNRKLEEQNLLSSRLSVELEIKNNEMEIANKKLMTMNIYKNRLFTLSSQDLRTPLTSIIGFSDLMLDGALGSLTDEQAEYLKYVNTAAYEMLPIVNDFLNISLVENGTVTMHMDEGSLKKLMENRLKTLKLIARRKKSVNIIEELAEVSGLRFDENRMSPALDTIISSAIKIATETSTIHVKLFSQNKTAIIEITLERVDVFPDMQTFLNGEPGAGLGLTIAKKIIKMHYGTIEVKKLEEVGVLFIITLPFET